MHSESTNPQHPAAFHRVWKILEAIALLVGICLWYYGLLFLGGAFTGAGHGTSFFIEIVFAPFSLSDSEFFALFGLALWPVVAILLGLRRFKACRLGAMAILLIHYLGILILIHQTEWDYIDKLWGLARIDVEIYITAYVLSQLFMWFLILSSWRNKLLKDTQL